jgi:hypothetical protein
MSNIHDIEMGRLRAALGASTDASVKIIQRCNDSKEEGQDVIAMAAVIAGWLQCAADLARYSGMPRPVFESMLAESMMVFVDRQTFDMSRGVLPGMLETLDAKKAGNDQ